MQELRVVGVEEDHLLLSGDDGRRYRITLDAELHAMLRRRPLPDSARRVSPREIQAHIRGGLNAREVAELTGAPLEYVEKFEGPVLAERRHIVESALAVTVNTAADTDSSSGTTFGEVIEERLTDVGATGSEWSAWKDPETGWAVRVGFTADEIEHDARWSFDPKKNSLAPLTDDAVRLSRQEQVEDSLIPRLRAVPSDIDRTPDTSRFDSGAFSDTDLGVGEQAPAGTIPFGRVDRTAAADAEQADTMGQTADLLEALRRRRGEREAPPTDDSDAPVRATRDDGMRLIDIPLDDFDDTHSRGPDTVKHDTGLDQLDGLEEESPATRQRSARRGRASMPSWDDIVFGARSDDD